MWCQNDHRSWTCEEGVGTVRCDCFCLSEENPQIQNLALGIFYSAPHVVVACQGLVYVRVGSLSFCHHLIFPHNRQDCKRQRRKCERKLDSSTCLRCERLRYKCVLFIERQSTDSELESSLKDELQYWRDQLAELEDCFRNLQLQKAQVQRITSKPDRLLDAPDTENTGTKPEPIAQSSPIWELRIVDGQLFLESSKRSVPELLMYGRAFNQYLAPFKGHFVTTNRFSFQGQRLWRVSAAAQSLLHSPIESASDCFPKDRNIPALVDQLVQMYIRK